MLRSACAAARRERRLRGRALATLGFDAVKKRLQLLGNDKRFRRGIAVRPALRIVSGPFFFNHIAGGFLGSASVQPSESSHRRFACVERRAPQTAPRTFDAGPRPLS